MLQQLHMQQTVVDFKTGVAAQAALAAVAAARQRLAPDYSCEPPHAGEKRFLGRSFRSNNVIAHGNHEGLKVAGVAGGGLRGCSSVKLRCTMPPTPSRSGKM